MERLKSERQKRVWTITDLAKQAGVSKNTISKAENGGSVYPVTVRKLATALEIEPRELIK